MSEYQENNGSTYRIKNGEPELLANFIARITEERRYSDGRSTETVLTITGEVAPPPQLPGDKTEHKAKKLPTIEINASEFPAMAWVLPRWGVQAVIQPGGSIRDDLRTAIQLASKPKVITVHKNTGWTEAGTYLHSRGAIGKGGNNKSVTVALPPELSRFELPDPPKLPAEAYAALLSSLALIQLGPPTVTWPLWCATYVPTVQEADFAVHLAGRTGTFKSELVSLFQSHYGYGMDARHLPGSWSSTGNALEAQAFLLKDALFAVDDFIPAGSTYQQKSYQQNADKLIRAQGNQAGRARLTDTSSLQQTYYPRGLIMSSGEDVPEGHSIRGRMLILELAPGDINPTKLTAAQASRDQYPVVMSAFIHHVAGDAGYRERIAADAQKLRLSLQSVGHARTPTTIATLLVVARYVLQWAEQIGMSKKTASDQFAQCQKALRLTAEEQKHYLESVDPVELFSTTLRAILETGYGHARTPSGGIPAQPQRMGWTLERDGDVPQYRSHGPTIGWADWPRDEFLLEAQTGVNLVLKHSKGELSLSRQVLLKRLKEAGALTRVEDGRQRNTARVTVQGHPRTVIVMSLSTLLDTNEIPQDAETPTPDGEF